MGRLLFIILALVVCGFEGNWCTISSATLRGFPLPLNTDDSNSATVDFIDSDIRHWIFPSLEILCNGEITGLSFIGVSDSNVELYPNLTVWSGGAFAQNSYTYKGGRSLSGVVSRTPELLATLDPPLPVRAGYFVGLYYPASGDLLVSVQPKFLDLGEGGANDSFYTTFDATSITADSGIGATRNNRYLPLIQPMVEVEVDSSASVARSSSSPVTTPPLTSSDSTPAPSQSIPSSNPPTAGRPTSPLSTTPSPSPLSSTPSPSSLSDTPSPSPTDLVGTDGTSSPGVNIVFIVAPILVILVLVLLAVVTVVVALLCVKHKHRALLKPAVSDQEEIAGIDHLHNPTYLGLDVNGTKKESVEPPSLSNGTYEYERTDTLPINSTHASSMEPQSLDPMRISTIYSLPDSTGEWSRGAAESAPLEASDSHGYAVPSVTSPASSTEPDFIQGYGDLSPMATMPSQYEVPVASGSLQSKEFDSRVPLPRQMESSHAYSVLECGSIYVPTEDERAAMTMSSKGTTLSSSLDGAGTDRRHYYHSLVVEKFFEEEDIYWRPASSERDLYNQLSMKKYREVLRQQLEIGAHLGSGQFGTVNKGVWQLPTETIEVAVKTLQPNASEMDKIKFLQEAAIMGQFSHPNVVKLHGVVTVGEPTMIVLEFMPKGDLRNWLHSQRPSTPEESVPADVPGLLLKFSREVAKGMAYLSQKAFVHRDLAARNILLDSSNTCKIGDFGMSRDLEDSNYYIVHGGQIPVKWTAPEALNFRKYSTASDVWSFAVVMYEIWSLGQKPFDGYTNIQALQLIGTGIRMAPPAGTPRPLYALMIRCWHGVASLRPTFSAIVNMLSHADPQLLSWSARDLAVHSRAACLGAPADVAEQLYVDLQDYYLDESSKRSTSSSTS